VAKGGDVSQNAPQVVKDLIKDNRKLIDNLIKNGVTNSKGELVKPAPAHVIASILLKKNWDNNYFDANHNLF